MVGRDRYQEAEGLAGASRLTIVGDSFSVYSVLVSAWCSCGCVKYPLEMLKVRLALRKRY